MEVKLYVGNLAYSTTEADLRHLFARAGGVTAVELVRDRGTGQSKGFAFVTMATQAAAQAAIKQFHAFSLAGRTLKVNPAKANPARTKETRNEGGYQSRLTAFASTEHRPKASASTRQPARSGYQSRLDAFGSDNSPPKPRRRGNR